MGLFRTLWMTMWSPSPKCSWVQPTFNEAFSDHGMLRRLRRHNCTGCISERCKHQKEPAKLFESAHNMHEPVALTLYLQTSRYRRTYILLEQQETIAAQVRWVTQAVKTLCSSWSRKDSTGSKRHKVKSMILVKGRPNKNKKNKNWVAFYIFWPLPL